MQPEIEEEPPFGEMGTSLKPAWCNMRHIRTKHCDGGSGQFVCLLDCGVPQAHIRLPMSLPLPARVLSGTR